MGFHRFKQTLEDLMRVRMIRKGNIFHIEVQSDSEKRLSGTQKVKFDIDFLGCVEFSTQCTQHFGISHVHLVISHKNV